MTQNPYGNPANPPYDANPDPYETPGAPVEPYDAAPRYASSEPYPDSDPAYAAPVEPYTEGSYAPVDPYADGESDDVKSVAKDEAANVKDTAVDEGQQVAGTAKEEAANVAGTAKAEAANVKETAVQAGQQVAGTAKEEATNVAVEAGGQAKDIARQAVGELQTQAGAQQQKIAGLVHSYAKELGSMASGSEESGPLTDLAHRASAKAGEIGHWLENREPREVVQELSSFARRRPGAFLVGAAVAGVIVGRLTRNLAAEAKDEAAPSSTTPGTTDASYASLDTGYADPSPAYLTPQLETQTGRYGDLASEDQVVSYDTPVRTTGQDVIR